MPPMYCWPWGELRLVMHCVHFGLVLAGPISPAMERKLHKDWCKFFNPCPNALCDCLLGTFCLKPYEFRRRASGWCLLFLRSRKAQPQLSEFAGRTANLEFKNPVEGGQRIKPRTHGYFRNGQGEIRKQGFGVEKPPPQQIIVTGSPCYFFKKSCKVVLTESCFVGQFVQRQIFCAVSVNVIT